MYTELDFEVAAYERELKWQRTHGACWALCVVYMATISEMLLAVAIWKAL